jgi:hypothetical protein
MRESLAIPATMGSDMVVVDGLEVGERSRKER